MEEGEQIRQAEDARQPAGPGVPQRTGSHCRLNHRQERLLRRQPGHDALQ